MRELLQKLHVLLDETILLVRAARKRQELGHGAPSPVDLYGPNGTEIRR